MKQWCAIALAAACAAAPAVAEPAGATAGAAVRPATQVPSARTVKVGDRPVYPGFTFRRIGLPDARSGRRITVQIDPEEQKLMLAAVMPRPENPIPRGGAAAGPVPPADRSAGAGQGSAAYDWFWTYVPTRIGAADGRFPSALAALNQGPGGASVAAPRLEDLQGVAAAHGREILEATVGTQVSPALVLAIIGIESAGRTDAVSSAGAVGLMQLIPATADRFGIGDSRDAGQNIRGGVAYLDWLMTEFNRDPVMVIAAYNAGENAVKAAGGVPAFPETRDYVPKVLAAWSVARGLCRTPPDLVTDGCVFAVDG